MIDFKVALIDGAFHDVDSSVRLEDTARCDARRTQEGRCQAAGADHEGRGRDPGGLYPAASATSPAGAARSVVRTAAAMPSPSTRPAPLANMFAEDDHRLRLDVPGRAVFTMQFSHYEAVPQNISDEIQAKFA